MNQTADTTSIASQPIRIGLLLNPDRTLKDWEIRLFSSLMKDQRYELVCIVTDGRPKPVARESFLSKLTKRLMKKALLHDVLLALVVKIENRGRQIRHTATDQQQIREKLHRIPIVPLTPVRKGYLDIFSADDCQALRVFHCDVLLRHEFGIIRGAIFDLPKFGIWSFHHGDNTINRGGPSGFWEAYLREPVIGVTLQVLEDEIDGGRVIAKGYYNAGERWGRNNEFASEKAVEILSRELRLLYENRQVHTTPSSLYSKQLYRMPDSRTLLSYAVSRYIPGAFHNIARKIGIDNPDSNSNNVWKLHLGKGDIFSATLWRTKVIEPPANEFWADPFLFDRDNVQYVFFENYEYDKRKGKISVGVIENGTVNKVQDALVTDYHLSYPFFVEYGGSLFMIPETRRTKRLEIWKCKEFPHNWALERTLFENTSMADSTVFCDENGKWWLFTSIAYDKFADHSSHLYIYGIDSPLMNNIVPHRLNPVVTDCRVARSAGPIFVDQAGRIIRPSQAYQNGVYGEHLNLCWVKELSLDDYEEVVLETITPTFKKNLNGVHHFSKSKELFVIDGRYKRR